MTDKIITCRKCGTKNYADEPCPKCQRDKVMSEKPFQCSGLSERSREDMEWQDSQRSRGIKKKNRTAIPEHMRKSWR